MCFLIFQKIYQINDDANDSDSELRVEMNHVGFHDLYQTIKVFAALICWKITGVRVFELGQESIVLCVFREHLHNLKDD